jgi:hypothetical protein
MCSFLAGLWIGVRALVWGIPVTGWASLIIAVFIVGGVQIFHITGVAWIYVGKNFEGKERASLFRQGYLKHLIFSHIKRANTMEAGYRPVIWWRRPSASSIAYPEEN